MKRIIILVAAAMVCVAGCKKYEAASSEANREDIVFTASIASLPKTTVVPTTGKVSWDNDDEITITDAGGVSAIYQVSECSGSTATFIKKAGQTAVLGSAPYSAVYGSSPLASQTWSETVKDLPMTAASATSSLTFQVSCGIMKLDLEKTGASISGIAVSDNNGTRYTLACEQPQSIDSEKSFCIILPAGTYTGIDFTHAAGFVCKNTVKTGKELVIAAGDILPISYDAMGSVIGVPVEGGSIVAALTAASSGQEIRTQSGTFELNSSLVLKEGVPMSGGWDGTFTTQEGKTTLLSKGTDRILLQNADFATETSVSNFIIKGGRTDDNSTSTFMYGGGGIFMRNGLVVENCEITDCQAPNAKGWGGGILMQGGTVRNCSIHGNSSGYVGGAFVTNANTKDTMGNCIIEDCDIYENTCPNFVIQLYTAEMRRCKVHDNTFTKNNIRLQTGGFMYDCLFCDNISTTAVDGVDVHVNNANSKIINCTFVGAKSPAGDNCAAVYIPQNATFVNNVVYAPTLKNDIKVASGKTPVFSNCFYKNGTNDTNAVDCNKTFDPESIFVSLSGKDYHPCATSALKNAGKDISGTSKSTLDLDRNARVCGTSVDVGCYEYQE